MDLMRTRRDTLKGLLAASGVALSGESFALSGDSGAVAGADFLNQLYSNATELTEAERSAIGKAAISCPKPTLEQLDWYGLAAGKRPPVSWPDDGNCIDYAHLLPFGALPQECVISHETLQFLCERNYFVLNSASPVCFGLRGCEPVTGAGDTGWGREHRVRNVRPDHRRLKCVLGVWDRAGRQVRLFSGSTVPEVTYIYAFANSYCAPAADVVGCNLMIPGLYRFTVGTHPRRPAPHRKTFFQPGALLGGSVAYMRTIAKLQYSPLIEHTTLEFAAVGDNVHASGSSVESEADAQGRPRFSSAGCQVIPGKYARGRAEGAWAGFREALGLSNPPSSTDNGKSIDYFLLTGADACCAQVQSKTIADEYWRLRPGSSGKRVAEYQRHLLQTGISNIAANGVYGPATFRAVTQLQSCNSQLVGSPVDPGGVSSQCPNVLPGS